MYRRSLLAPLCKGSCRAATEGEKTLRVALNEKSTLRPLAPLLGELSTARSTEGEKPPHLALHEKSTLRPLAPLLGELSAVRSTEGSPVLDYCQ